MVALRARSAETTMVVGHGCNPGLVSHFCKRALLEVAAQLAVQRGWRSLEQSPRSRTEWAELAARLSIRAILISERDTQQSPLPLQPNQFTNTWSVESMLDEMTERPNFANGSHEQAAQGAIRCLPGHAALWRVSSWEPGSGRFIGAVVPHPETFTIADYLTTEANRPTVFFAYQPCPHGWFSLLDSASRDFLPPARSLVMRHEIERGGDNVGVLIFSTHPKLSTNGYFYGSQLDIHAARAITPHANATSLQVAAGVISGLAYLLLHPRNGLCEPEDLDHEEILEIAKPYLGTLVGMPCPWRPSKELQFEDFLIEPSRDLRSPRQTDVTRT